MFAEPARGCNSPAARNRFAAPTGSLDAAIRWLLVPVIACFEKTRHWSFIAKRGRRQRWTASAGLLESDTSVIPYAKAARQPRGPPRFQTLRGKNVL